MTLGRPSISLFLFPGNNFNVTHSRVLVFLRGCPTAYWFILLLLNYFLAYRVLRVIFILRFTLRMFGIKKLAAVSRNLIRYRYFQFYVYIYIIRCIYSHL